MIQAIAGLRLVQEVFPGEGRLDLDLRGWAESTRKTLAFQLGLRESTVKKSRGGMDSLLSPRDSKKPSLTLQTGLNVFKL